MSQQSNYLTALSKGRGLHEQNPQNSNGLASVPFMYADFAACPDNNGGSHYLSSQLDYGSSICDGGRGGAMEADNTLKGGNTYSNGLVQHYLTRYESLPSGMKTFLPQ